MSFPVNDWEVIPLEVLKNVLSEVKEKFDLIAVETESVTEKSIKCLLGFATYFFGVGVFLLKEHHQINWAVYILLTILSALLAKKGYHIVTLRPSHTAGLLPENVLSKDFEADSGFTDEEKEKLFYFNAIKTYTQKVKEGLEDNGKRAKNYDRFIRYTLLLVFGITIFLLFTISYRPVFVRS